MSITAAEFLGGFYATWLLGRLVDFQQEIAKDYPMKLRRIKYHDATTNKTFVFLTNNFALPALTIAELYRRR